MKKLILIIVLALFVCGSIQSTQVYTFKTQSMVLYNQIFPAVKKYISDFKILPYTQDKGQLLVDTVGEIINNYSVNGSIKLHQYPDVSLFKYENDLVVAYHIKVILLMIDSDADPEFPVMILIAKHFMVIKYSKGEHT